MGAFGQPTIINNVETLMSVVAVMDLGGKAYADLGVEGEGGQRAIAISGHVKDPGVYEIPCGKSLLAIIEEDAGGMRNPDKPLSA